MIIELEDGRKLEVQDGATSDQIDAIISEVTASPSGFTPDIQQKAVKPEGLNPIMFPDSAVANRNKEIEKHNQYERSFIGNEERQKLKKEEEQRPFLSGVAEGIKHIGKEFYTGTLQSPDFLPSVIQSVLDYKLGGDNSKTREEAAEEIDNYMLNENERYGITRGENMVATTLGEMIPFLATGMAGEKALINVGTKLAPKLKQSSIAINKALGNTVEATRIANAPKKFNSSLVDISNSVARGTITGAAEGAAQHDTSAAEGALYSLIGGAGAHMGIMSPLRKVRNERDAAGKKLIDDMYEQSFNITPGIRTGNRALQTEEAAIRNSDLFGQDFHNAVDRPNQRRITDMAGEAIGLNTKDQDLLSQQELADHMANLKNKYQELEANTVGKITLDSKQRIGRILKDTQPVKNRNQSQAARQRHATLVDVSNEINTVLQPFTDRNGKFIVQRFDGSKYQAATQYMNDQISKAYSDGDRILATHLKNIKAELDKSIESGMGKTNAKKWRDLNEQFAMTQILMKNGLTPSGKVDASKITSAMMSEDEAIRTLTGKGNKIRKFQDIARYNDILHGKDVMGSDLTGLGMHEAKPNRGMMTRAADLLPTPMQALRLGYKTNTLSYPFIGRRLSPAHGLSTEALTNLGRSFGQTETVNDMINNTAENALAGYEEIKKMLGVE